jgi:signal transduction histidine kinase
MNSKIKYFSPKLSVIQIFIILMAFLATFLIANNFFKQNLIIQAEAQLNDSLVLSKKLVLLKKSLPKDWCSLFEKNQSRITVVDNKGHVLCDSSSLPAEMENHKNRPEITQAAKDGIGKSIRLSETLDINMLYGAIKLEVFNRIYFLRKSIPFETLNNVMRNLEKSIFLFLIPVFVLLSAVTNWIVVLKDSQAKNANLKMKTDLIANISHEVRTPLTALKGYVEVIRTQKDKLPKDFQEYLDRVEYNAERLTILFKDVLDLSELENEQELFIEVLDVQDITQNVISNVTQSYIDKLIKVETDIQIKEFEGDAKFVVQLLNNLVDNAFKYNKESGDILVTWKKVNQWAQLSVKDNGLGILDDDAQKIFERFYRTDECRSRELGGTGLGLSIVKHAVQRHKGIVWVESEEGKGSTFFVNLPLKQI